MTIFPHKIQVNYKTYKLIIKQE